MTDYRTPDWKAMASAMIKNPEQAASMLKAHDEAATRWERKQCARIAEEEAAECDKQSHVCRVGYCPQMADSYKSKHVVSLKIAAAIKRRGGA